MFEIERLNCNGIPNGMVDYLKCLTKHGYSGLWMFKDLQNFLHSDPLISGPLSDMTSSGIPFVEKIAFV